MAAVAFAFAHKAIRNAKLDYHDPEFELTAQGYKRTKSSVARKQPVTTLLLRKMGKLSGKMDQQTKLLWGSVILGFFFPDRCSEIWGPVTVDGYTGVDRAHCVKAHNVIF
jgi:hypothetical protein